MSLRGPDIAHRWLEVGDHVRFTYMALSDEYERFDRFDGEYVMGGLQLRFRIFVNGILITNPYYDRERQFLGDS